jgi:hypothetical protein
MNESKGTKIIGCLGLLVIVLSLSAVAWALWPWFAANTPLNQTLLTAGVAFASSTLSIAITKNWDRQKEIQQEHRKQKTPMYEKFVAFLFKLFMAGKNETSLPQAEILESMVEFTRGMTIWASNDVVQKYGAFRTIAATDGGNMMKMAQALEDILVAVRMDLGHPSGLKRGELLRTFINDADVLLSGDYQSSDKKHL